MWFRKHVYSLSNIQPVVSDVTKVEKEGMPVRSVQVVKKKVQMNSISELSKYPKVNQDALEIAISTGLPIDNVSSTVLTPDRISDLELNSKLKED